MKFIFISVFISLSIFQTLDLNTVRTNYKNAAQNTNNINTFYNDLVSITKENRVELVAYKGASIALKARGSKTIKEKKDGFIKGVSFVEYAIKKEPNNIETRFIRLTIQENTPKLLKYKSNIEEDKLFILKNYKATKNTSLKTQIADYISHSKVFTSEEKALILTP